MGGPPSGWDGADDVVCGDPPVFAASANPCWNCSRGFFGWTPDAAGLVVGTAVLDEFGVSPVDCPDSPACAGPFDPPPLSGVGEGAAGVLGVAGRPPEGVGTEGVRPGTPPSPDGVVGDSGGSGLDPAGAAGPSCPLGVLPSFEVGAGRGAGSAFDPPGAYISTCPPDPPGSSNGAWTVGATGTAPPGWSSPSWTGLGAAGACPSGGTFPSAPGVPSGTRNCFPSDMAASETVFTFSR